MTQFQDYDALIRTIGQRWLARSDIENDIKDFIWLTECDLQRICRFELTDAKVTDTTVDGDDFIILPEDFQSGVALRWLSDDTLPTLELASFDQVDRAQKGLSTNWSQPRVGDVFGNRLYIGFSPGITEYELFYRRGVVHLGAKEPTNVLLREHPDALLYGSLVEAGLFLRDPARVQEFAPMYERASQSACITEERRRWGSGPLRMRPGFRTF